VDLDRRSVELGDLSVGAKVDAPFQEPVRTCVTYQASTVNEAETQVEYITRYAYLLHLVRILKP
jgi:hypothetical protein